MPFGTSTKTRIIAVAMLVILLVAQQVLGMSGCGRLARGVQNAMHGPWFATVTVLVWVLLFRPISVSMGKGMAVFLLAVSALFLATATEYVQVLTGRQASLQDIMLDMGGAAATAAAIFSRERHRRGNMMQATIVALVGITCFLWSISPVLIAAATNAHRDRMVPHLVGFESRLDYAILRTNSEVQVVSAPPTWDAYEGRSVLKVQFAQTQWPGITLQETISDWSRYSVLVLDVFSEMDRITRLSVSVRPNDPLGNGTLNFFQVLRLKPGANEIRLSIDSLLPDRDTRIWEVQDVLVYTDRSHAGQVVYIGQVALE